MTELFEHSLSVFLGFFAIMNPIANTAVFVGLTKDLSRTQRVHTATKALVTCFLIVTVFALLGKTLFHFFGITLSALRIAGGILVFVIGYHMLQGQSSNLHQQSDQPEDDIAISPLAIPILAGPGTIATAMNYSASGEWTEISITIIIFAGLCLTTFVCFIVGQQLVSLFGKSGISIANRLMGLILTVIGVQMVISGVTEVVAHIPA